MKQESGDRFAIKSHDWVGNAFDVEVLDAPDFEELIPSDLFLIILWIKITFLPEIGSLAP